MRKYTVKIHRQRLLRMLKKKEPCLYCPASRHYAMGVGTLSGMWTNFGNYPWLKNNICGICRSFIGLKSEPSGIRVCPCHVLGKKRALKRTYEALGL